MTAPSGSKNKLARVWLLGFCVFFALVAAVPSRHLVSTGTRKLIPMERQVQRDVGRAERDALRRLAVAKEPPSSGALLDAVDAAVARLKKPRTIANQIHTSQLFTSTSLAVSLSPVLNL
jgi:hypothetical protein